MSSYVAFPPKMADVEAPLTEGSPAPRSVSVGQRVSQTFQTFGTSLVPGFGEIGERNEKRTGSSFYLNQDGDGKRDRVDFGMVSSRLCVYGLAVSFGLGIGFVCAWYCSTKNIRCW